MEGKANIDPGMGKVIPDHVSKDTSAAVYNAMVRFYRKREEIQKQQISDLTAKLAAAEERVKEHSLCAEAIEGFRTRNAELVEGIKKLHEFVKVTVENLDIVAEETPEESDPQAAEAVKQEEKKEKA